MTLHIYLKSGSHMIINATSGLRDSTKSNDIWIDLYEFNKYTLDNSYHLRLKDISGVYNMDPANQYDSERDYLIEVDYFNEIFGPLIHHRKYDDIQNKIYKYDD